MSPERRPGPSIDDVQPPVRPQSPEYRYDHELPAPKQPPLIEQRPVVQPKPLSPEPDLPTKRPSSRRKKLLAVLGGIILAVVVLMIAAFVWYQQQLSPVSSDTAKHVRVVIEPGTTPTQIADTLKQAGVIHSQFVFAIYTKLTDTENILKAGTYNLKPSESLSKIVDHLVAGKQDEFSITFLPGATLQDHRKQLISAGYSEQEVDSALAKQYDRPLLFDGKPASADLEGYIYGETYSILSSASVEDILNRTFDEYEAVIKQNDLTTSFKKQGFTLYQGITMASIVQREVPTPDDQAEITRVFLNRLEAGMTLGSDVTYQYIADKTGVERSPTLDSPYNTRRYPGLPPGPIASPGLSALKALASPGTNDYLFFLSGDDNVTYFGKTDAEHQQNIVNHCQKKCLIN